MNLFLLSICSKLLFGRYKAEASKFNSSVVVEGSADFVHVVRSLVKANPYVPPLYAAVVDYHGQLQSVLQSFFRSLTSLSLKNIYTREILLLSDGGIIALDWISLRDAETSESLGIVIINHGLCGDSTSEYLVHTATKLLRKGFRVVAIVARGLGGLTLTTPSVFVGKRTGRSDLEEAIEYIHQKFPTEKLFGLGYSLGIQT